jgi:hypothetical protein
MARALTEPERLRYPWASQITDYVPVGRLRRIGLALSTAGFALLAVGILLIYVVTMHVHLHNGVPQGAAEWIVYLASLALVAAGFVIGLVTAGSAIARRARLPLLYSLGAMILPVLWLLIVLR